MPDKTTIDFKLRADSAEFTGAMKRAEGQLNRSFKSMSGSTGKGAKIIKKDFDAISNAAGGAATNLKSIALTIGGFAVGGGGLAALAKNAVDLADGLAKTSSRLGITTDELQRYQFAAELSGVKTETFNMAFQRFGRRIGEASQGTGEAVGALESLDINLRNLDGTLRPVNEVFDEAIDKLAQVEDVTLRNAIAMKLFDSEGVALTQIGDKLGALKKQADDLGVIIPEDMLRNAEQVNDKLAIMSKVIQVKLTKALVDLSPAFDSLANGALLVADNFESIVSWAGKLAKLIVAIKLASFARGLFVTGTAAAAAAKGIFALTLSMKALKRALLIGFAFEAVEILLSKFIDSIDDSTAQLGETIKRTGEEVKNAEREISEERTKITEKDLRARKNYTIAIDQLTKAEIKSLEDAGKAQKKILNDQQKELDKSIIKAKSAADEFKDAFEVINGASGDVEATGLIDISVAITKARKQLAGGEFEDAVKTALTAKEMVLQLKESGQYADAVLTGTLKKAEAIQSEASQTLIEQQKTVVEQTQATIQKIQSQLNLISSISFGFDEVGSIEEAQRVINLIKDQIEKHPIVVPVVLGSPSGLDVGGDAPGFASGGHIRGPGSGTSDSILARLSNGEFVMTAAAVKRYGVDFMNMINAGRLPGFASGGAVNMPSSTPSSVVNVSLDGRSFSMKADSSVAGEFGLFVKRQALKSGRK